MNPEMCLSCEAIERYLGKKKSESTLFGGSRSTLNHAPSTRSSALRDAEKARCCIFLDCSIRPMLAEASIESRQC